MRSRFNDEDLRRVNENRNMVLAIVLSALVLLGWSLLSERIFPTTAPQSQAVNDGKTVPSPTPQPTEAAPVQLRSRAAVIGETPRVRFGNSAISGSLLIAKPVSAVVVLAEASLTFGIFRLLSERLSGPTRWSSFFGRDRFMGLILVSAGVRLLLDGWLLPLAAERLDSSFGWQLDWRHNLHAFGLIVVALWANQLWKPGRARRWASARLG